MMKIKILLVALIACAPSLFAQRSQTEYATRYKLLTDRMGPAGVGVETLVTNWEKDYPDDVNMLCAKFSFYFAKSQHSTVVAKDQDRFMGASPLLTIPDTAKGTKVHYFEETFYDDSLFGLSSAAIEKAIRLRPMDVDLRFNRITALIQYEKESPDMASAALTSLIDYQYTEHPVWLFKGETLDDEFFRSAIQEYCYTFFRIGSDISMASFKSLSERMLKYNPDNAVFMNNLGSYVLVHEGDAKGALKIYKKILKSSPDDYTAVKNCTLAARTIKDVKTERKYLEILRDITSDDSEKAACDARLVLLMSKK